MRSRQSAGRNATRLRLAFSSRPARSTVQPPFAVHPRLTTPELPPCIPIFARYIDVLLLASHSLYRISPSDCRCIVLLLLLHRA